MIGFSQFSPTVAQWFALNQPDGPTLGGFLYLTVASMIVGMTISALRWATIDRLHAMTGVRMPALDFSRLGNNVAAFRLLIEIHYRHYLFYSNMGLASAIAYLCYRVAHFDSSMLLMDLGFIFLEAVFIAASRDTLNKYYSRGGELLGLRRQSVEPATRVIPQSIERDEPTSTPNAAQSSESRLTKSASDRP